jgi:hypothetical protein
MIYSVSQSNFIHHFQVAAVIRRDKADAIRAHSIEKAGDATRTYLRIGPVRWNVWAGLSCWTQRRKKGRVDSNCKHLWRRMDRIGLWEGLAVCQHCLNFQWQQRS